MLFSRKNKQRQQAPIFSFCEPGAKGLKAWAAVLPRKDAMTLSKLLVRAGNELTASNCTLGEITELLEVLKEPVMTAADGLLQLSGINQRQVDIYRKRQAFFNLYGRIYYLVAQKQHAIKPDSNCDEWLLTASQFFCEATIASHQLYETPPPGCWLGLHSIYAYSLSHARGEASTMKLSANYKTAAALSCANTEKLSNAQIEVLTEFMRTALASIRICACEQDKTFHSVLMTDDQPPGRVIKNIPTLGDAAEAAVDSNTIYFDFSGLESVLTAGSLSPELQRHIKTSFGPSAVRAFPRHVPVIGEAGFHDDVLEICFGLSAIHYYLCGKVSLEMFVDCFDATTKIEQPMRLSSLRTIADNEARKRKQAFEGDQKDTWNDIYQTNWQSIGSSGNLIESEIIEKTKLDAIKLKHDFPVQKVSIEDLNARGYRLSGNDAALKEYRTGALIGIKNPNQPHWHVAVVRWSKSGEEKKTLGVELLDPNIQACGVRILHTQHSAEFKPALLLPPESPTSEAANDDGQAVTETSPAILMPRIDLSGKTSAQVITIDEQYNIMLGNCIEQSANSSRYEYSAKEPNQ